MALEGFDTSEFRYEGETRAVYRGGQGPGVVVMHEIPGITPEVAGFARRVVEAGFSVYMPDMFGTAGKRFSLPYVASQMARACISREFHVLASHRASPITDWLRALCRHAHAEQGGPGVGAIGMCLTGNFALALMVDPSVMAPVLSQPSLPFGVTPTQRAALHVSEEQLETIRKRARSGCPVLGMRFTADPMCPPERFETLRRELGEDGFEGIEIDSSSANPHGIGRTAHSVVTTDLVDEAGHPTREALDRVLGFFAERLQPASAS